MPTKDYAEALDDCKRHHLASKTFSGSLALPHAALIKEMIDRLEVKTVLDYGCGKGLQYTEAHPTIGLPLDEYWGVEVTKYDPAWGPFANEPEGVFDLVICTHVLGSIPRADIGWVVERLYGFASKGLYIGELIGPVKKKVFRNPDAVLKGLSEADWVKILAREAPIEAVLAVRTNEEAEAAMRLVRLS